MNESTKPGHNLGMAAIEVNRLLNRYHMDCLSPSDIEAAIIKGLWEPGGPSPDDKLNRLIVAVTEMRKWVERALALLDDRQAEIGKIQRLRAGLRELNSKLGVDDE